MVATQPVDFRRGMNGLVALVASALAADPYCGDVFVFRAKRLDRLRCIYWDGSGMILATKWLEAGKFVCGVHAPWTFGLHRSDGNIVRQVSSPNSIW